MSEAMDGTQGRAPSIARYALAAGVVSAAAGALAVAFAGPDVRRAALFGAVASAVGAAVALAGLAVGVKKGVQGLLAGFGLGFLARMIAVATGLIASGAKGHAALIYVAAFFAIYAVTQAAEIAYVWATSRARTAKV